jgi:hypothetical protein
MNPKVEELLLLAKAQAAKVKEQQKVVEVVEVTNQLPVIYEQNEQLGLDLSQGFTNENIMNSVKVQEYKNLSLTQDQAFTAKRKVGRLTTGASAAVPLACKGSTCPFKATCVTEDTLVMTQGKHQFKKIKDLKKNSKIYSFNIETGLLEKDTVVQLHNQGVKEVYRIITKLGKYIECTDDHPILTTDANSNPIFMKLKTGLNIGSTIFIIDYDNEFVELDDFGDLFIDTIAEICYVGLKNVYDITVKNNSTFIANGIAVHNCQPGDEQVLVAGKGYINIQDLNPLVDKVVTMNEKTGQLNTTGKTFTLHHRNYSDTMYKISDGFNSYKCTSDHICYATFNKTAIKKHIVYLMRAGDKFRVGVTTLIQEMPKNKDKVGPRYQFGLRVRLNMEKADCAWILGVYNTRVDALLDEEYFSIKLNAPKSLFIADDATRHTTWNGKGKWVTQEQLNLQFDRLNKTEEFYASFLKSINLDINHPFIYRNSRSVIQVGAPMHVRACNLLEGYMDVVSIDNVSNTVVERPLKIVSKDFYHGSVYSLNVEDDHNYFTTGGILTKNCPYYEINAHQIGEDCLVESQLIEFYTSKFIQEFDIDPNSITEVHLISRLVEITIYEIRMTKYMKLNDQDLMADFITGSDANGAPISNKGVSIALEVQERLSRQKMKILESLNGTRERKAKLIIDNGLSNKENSLTELKSKIDRLAAAMSAKIVGG